MSLDNYLAFREYNFQTGRSIVSASLLNVMVQNLDAISLDNYLAFRENNFQTGRSIMLWILPRNNGTQFNKIFNLL